MSRRWLLLVVVILASISPASAQQRRGLAPLFAESVFISNGYITGDRYRRFDAPGRQAYASGLIDGMLLAPMFGAPQAYMKRLKACLNGMTNEQVAAILDLEVQAHPEDWNNSAHMTLYRALNDRCPE